MGTHRGSYSTLQTCHCQIILSNCLSLLEWMPLHLFSRAVIPSAPRPPPPRYLSAWDICESKSWIQYPHQKDGAGTGQTMSLVRYRGGFLNTQSKYNNTEQKEKPNLCSHHCFQKCDILLCCQTIQWLTRTPNKTWQILWTWEQWKLEASLGVS